MVCFDVYFRMDAVRIACGAVFFYQIYGTADKMPIKSKVVPLCGDDIVFFFTQLLKCAGFLIVKLIHTCLHVA